MAISRVTFFIIFPKVLSYSYRVKQYNGPLDRVHIFDLSFRFGHATEVQGLHRLAAAFENEAARRTLFFVLG